MLPHLKKIFPAVVFSAKEILTQHTQMVNLSLLCLEEFVLQCLDVLKLQCVCVFSLRPVILSHVVTRFCLSASLCLLYYVGLAEMDQTKSCGFLCASVSLSLLLQF